MVSVPQAYCIQAKFGESIASMAVRRSNPKLPEATTLLYTIVFPREVDLLLTTKAVGNALKSAGLSHDVLLNDQDLTVEVRDELLRRPDPYKGLGVLQKLLRPIIPRAAMVFQSPLTGNRWEMQFWILGGFLPRKEVGVISRAVALKGGRVTRVVQTSKLQAEVFFITVPAEARRSLLAGLQEMCGVFSALQDERYAQR